MNGNTNKMRNQEMQWKDNTIPAVQKQCNFQASVPSKEKKKFSTCLRQVPNHTSHKDWIQWRPLHCMHSYCHAAVYDVCPEIKIGRKASGDFDHDLAAFQKDNNNVLQMTFLKIVSFISKSYVNSMLSTLKYALFILDFRKIKKRAYIFY